MKSSVEWKRSLEEDEDHDTHRQDIFHGAKQRRYWYSHTATQLLLVGLLISLAVNAIFALKALQSEKPDSKGQTAFGHLEWNTESEFTYGSIYNSDNATATNEAWESINYDHGTIALDNSYAESMGLPEAQPFPWDSSKGLYFLNGYHSLHCVMSIRRATVQLMNGEPTSHDISHIMHCFESLLQDVYCYADDTPRYESFDHPGRPGYGQKRQCRDWNQLKAFSEEHYSCWRNLNPFNKTYDTLLRYRFCPEGSPYIPYVKAIFGDTDE